MHLYIFVLKERLWHLKSVVTSFGCCHLKLHFTQMSFQVLNSIFVLQFYSELLDLYRYCYLLNDLTPDLLTSNGSTYEALQQYLQLRGREAYLQKRVSFLWLYLTKHFLHFFPALTSIIRFSVGDP